MSATSSNASVARPPKPAPRPATVPPIGSPTGAVLLANDLARLHAEEQASIDRERQNELARLQELARFD